MPPGSPKKKAANSLLALSSAAVVAVYSAGYVRTRAAAERFAVEAAVRRPVAPIGEARVPIAEALAATTSIAPVAGVHASPAAAARVGASTGAQPRERLSLKPMTSPRTGQAAAIAAAPAPAADAVETPALPTPSVPVPPPGTTAVGAPQADLAVPNTAAVPAAPRWKDGVYTGWGTSRHGDIQAQVVIQNGRIASATIAQCLTRYPCSVIGGLLPQVAQRQSPEVDYVSGATQSANAFYAAVVEALAKAK